MLPIYICEDDKIIREFLTAQIQSYIMIQGYDMEVVLSTGSPEQLLERVADNSERSVYFLDVDLQNMEWDGFKLGKEIRKTDSRGFIIYVTSHDELAFETFRYHIEVMDYISKSDKDIMVKQIRQCIDTIFRRMQQEGKEEQQEYFTVKVGDTVKYIPVSQIYCFETTGRTHRIVMHAEDEMLDFIGKLQEIEKQLGERFIRSHRSYLINCDKIKEMDIKNNQIIMENGQTCLVSRKMKAELKEITGAV